jgi:flagella synthesis protein FlgN
MAIDTATLTRTLDLEVAALRAFIDLLRIEQKALVRGDSDQIAAFVEPKAQHMFELTRFGEERGRLLSSLGLGADRAGMERLLREHAGGAAAPHNAWRQLLQLTETARQINTTNGTLIAARLSSTQRALNAIFSAARLPGAYGSDGSTVSLRTAQQLAVA